MKEGLADSMMPVQLLVVSGPCAGRRFGLHGNSLILGRSARTDIPLVGDLAVSERHARLFLSADGWTLSDLDSKNGTTVERASNLHAVDKPLLLQIGDNILVGQTVLVVARQERVPEQLDTVAVHGTSNPTIVPEEKVVASRTDAPPVKPNVSAPLPLHVGIECRDNALAFELLSPGAVNSRYSLPFNDKDVCAILEHVRDAALVAQCTVADSPESTQAGAALQRAGEFIGAHLFPPEVRRALEEAAGGDLVLRLDRRLIHIPWELARVGGAALCQRFAVGRQILLDDFPPANRNAARSPVQRLLIVSNPTKDLPCVSEETQALFDWLRRDAPGLSVEFLAGGRVERFSLLEHISRCDMVYFAGHALYDPREPMNSGWPLATGRVTCADFRSLTAPPRFVFANGCETGREAQWSSTGIAAGATYGIASGFILAGVSSYLGTAWPIAPEPGMLFARTFFAQVLAGHPTGECVRRAREEAGACYGAGNPVWASYQFYGDPSERLV